MKKSTVDSRQSTVQIGSRLALLGLVTALWLLPAGTRVALDRDVLPADGVAIARVSAHRVNVFGVRLIGAPLEVSSDGLATVLPSHDGSTIVRAGTRAGTLVLSAGDARVELRIELSTKDADEDGLPDAAELIGEEDRAAFSGWFTAIAEAQVAAIDDAWPKVHQDCAGLVRFAYREALKVHDASWLAKRKQRISIGRPDVGAFRYPELPFMGELPFRAIAGRFDPDVPASAQFTAAAGARALWEHNTRLVSRRLEDARAGDLLFFSVPLGTGSRMHAMILLGDRPGAGLHDAASRVVYHTGGEGEAGDVRSVSLAALLAHPDPSWHPLPHNPRFLGVHRFELLIHEARTPLASLEGRR